ncbi:D-glycero-beta-D-manno-heptose-7-phosphate kinase [Mucilaginibacter ginkgonis]|uniref:D-glycero-beta-D-manno-heptose-7-phosphate kinase n=1 Tax=Mucilaginibacter ginkgonis TaxID=2682091 RepID=A0A6I4IP44_9SPHI|nr:D-glycero-beta-D-manno-heptose-7-phosphate kinase [Mucilaginibacter ginkgonis]QQL50712.1 D-glycero-beta-D-manno-heptose-7-phosphate kinase [Mucilaginibacter ginkgonis]
MLADKLRKLDKTKQPNILVVGDLMLDRYVWGSASRISPEAPVPIVHVNKETATVGGAANVAQNLVSLGAKVTLVGITGNDAASDELKVLLEAKGISARNLSTDISRPTTVKTRYLSGNYQMLRVDVESNKPLIAEIEKDLLIKLDRLIAQADIILLSDYNKGLFTPTLTQYIINAANEAGKKVIIDPKGPDYSKYAGAFIIKPNRKELAEAAKITGIGDVASLQKAGDIILSQTGIKYLVVTLSEEGMAIISLGGTTMLPVKATEVFDVTGAGDTVLAAIAYFVASGFSVEEACVLANHAAAIVIKHVGNAVTTVDDILKHITNN